MKNNREKKFHFIYKTTNVLTNRYYFGMHSTNNLEDGYMGAGRRLKHSINKYGKLNHKLEIIEFLPDRISLIKREQEIVNLNEIAKDECINLMIGGCGGFISEEQQKHRSVCGGKAFAEKLKNDEEFRKKHKEIVSKNMKNSHINRKIGYNTFDGKIHTEKTKKLISDKMKNRGVGSENSQYGTCWVFKDGINKKIKKENLEIFIKDGWGKGRKLK